MWWNEVLKCIISCAIIFASFIGLWIAYGLWYKFAISRFSDSNLEKWRSKQKAEDERAKAEILRDLDIILPTKKKVTHTPTKVGDASFVEGSQRVFRPTVEDTKK